ncbi:bifunctional Acyl transferase-acyl hydrolase-lysophospholipase/Patatin-like phospholipase domain/Armadillo-like helical/Armadillo-type fold [Babesia duncani]|uniref:Bifunctional Acyl transferase-acyl hydrolase-lysophospholipase/Patatin-like phospholipase domain/Armadillo-like helical/Armadillo-type fold n=1 Tax=Babesia duncani TaxID=323732 RepID=A0AAD9UNH2_9APIC|nr:bifunctional Acyl transferase-acyl hydrolase-lysophospholipase/Patatin-like phospholipase domain/Armadillo-like helical/Armadillo-type fold [Babesia duncani]
MLVQLGILCYVLSVLTCLSMWNRNVLRVPSYLHFTNLPSLNATKFHQASFIKRTGHEITRKSIKTLEAHSESKITLGDDHCDLLSIPPSTQDSTESRIVLQAFENALNTQNVTLQRNTLVCLGNIARTNLTLLDKLAHSSLVDTLVKVLEAPYRKSLWKFVNSCIWTAESISEEHVACQHLVLEFLQTATLTSQYIRTITRDDEKFKETLLKIYHCQDDATSNDTTVALLIEGIFRNIGFTIQRLDLKHPESTPADTSWSWDRVNIFKNGEGLDHLLFECHPVEPLGQISQQPITWIPYCYQDTSDRLQSLQRYMNIWFGTESYCMQMNLNDITLDMTDASTTRYKFGMLALANAKPIANVQVPLAMDLNLELLLKRLTEKTNDSSCMQFKTLADCYMELWKLIGTQDDAIVDAVFKIIDLNRLQEILHSSLQGTLGGTAKVDSPPHPARVTSRIDGLSHYIFPWFTRATEFFTRMLRHTKSPEAEPRIPLDFQVKNLHAITSGLLLDLIYSRGSQAFNAIYNNLALVSTLEQIRAMYPATIPPRDYNKDTTELDTTGEYTPILDKRRLDRLYKTRVVAPPGMKPTRVQEAANSLDSLLGFLTANLDTWRMDFYKRQRQCPRSDLGAIYNCNKLLNLLGHHPQETFGSGGVRILSLDGGGTKGVIALEILARIVDKIKKPLYESFDFICGTSTGGLLAALIALERVEIADIMRMYESFISHVFVKDSYHVTGTRLLTKYAYYDDKLLRELLEHSLGNYELVDYTGDSTCPKYFCMSTKLNENPLKPILWRNYNYPRESQSLHFKSIMEGSCVISLVDAIRATTAAPGFFTLYERNNGLYGDGALHSNNPSLVALEESKLVYPNKEIECIVSVGNGDVCSGLASEEEIDRVVENAMHHEGSDSKSMGVDKMINQLINAATNTDIVHRALENFMPSNRYFRFDPPIPLVRFDETDPKVLLNLRKRASEYMQTMQQQQRLEELGKVLKDDIY